MSAETQRWFVMVSGTEQTLIDTEDRAIYRELRTVGTALLTAFGFDWLELAAFPRLRWWRQSRLRFRDGSTLRPATEAEVRAIREGLGRAS